LSPIRRANIPGWLSMQNHANFARIAATPQCWGFAAGAFALIVGSALAITENSKNGWNPPIRMTKYGVHSIGLVDRITWQFR
jgi:hypothetical protein